MEDIIDLNSPKSLGEIVLPNVHPSSEGAVANRNHFFF